MAGYDHKAIEKKWQDKWSADGAFNTPDTKEGAENFYFLTEFPYPSGNLHVGHWYAFGVPDIFARYMRARGHNVLYPIGFDAFGLPAENAAIKNNLNPREWTFGNIEYMRKQLRSMGASFDWSREVITADPSYYKWTQWLFLQFYKKGLVYRKETAVNWCPNDKTVLANEQVVDGVCERCGATVEQRQMPQWNIKITDYADRLIDDLKDLDWPRQIKDAQINWIGRSEGAEIDFLLNFTYDKKANDNRGPNGERAAIKIFTTRPDTLYGGTYLVLAPEHPWVTLAIDDKHDVLENKDEVKAYIEKTKYKSELERTENKEKTGVELKGVKAINPATKEEIPMWVADFVLGQYGTGAVFADAHDERDFEFAKKFNIPLKETLEPIFIKTTGADAVRMDLPLVKREAVACVVKHWSEDKYLCLKWKNVDWAGFVTGGIDGDDPVEAGRREILEETGYTSARFVKELGQVINVQFYHVNKKENRWARFRGMYYELEHGEQNPVSDEEKKIHDIVWCTKDEVEKLLSVPDMKRIWHKAIGIEEPYTGKGILFDSGEYSGLTSDEAIPKITAAFGTVTKKYHLRDWVVSRQRFWGVPIPMIKCEKCGYNPVKEEELPVVLPDLEDYLPTGEGKSPLAKKRDWVEVKCPSCGGAAERETDTLDTFVDSSWYYLAYSMPEILKSQTTNLKEFKNPNLQNWMPVDLYSGGSEHTTMHLLYSRFWHKAMFDLGLVGESEPYLRRMNRGLIMGPDGQKMSKSKGNVIDPDAVVAELGADTVRMYLAFIGPFNEVGSYPWNPAGAIGVRRFLDRVWRLEVTDDAPEASMDACIEMVTKSIDSLKLNTGVAALMTVLNEFDGKVRKQEFEIFLKLLAPFAPHSAAELAEKNSINLVGWPTFDPSNLQSTTIKIAVQVNGKVRGTVELAVDTPEAEALAKGREVVAKWLAGPIDGAQGKEKKAVYIGGKVINFVV